MADIESDKSSTDFKKPQLLPKVEPNSMDVDEIEPTELKNEGKNETSSPKSESRAKSTSSKKLIDIPLPYQEPTWSGCPPNGFSLEIIKNGTFVEMFPFKSPVTVFGRLDVCDIKFEHPSVSRFQAVIQYCSGDDSIAPGFYLYDLGSTHGTYLNKDKISPKIYYKLKVGYILKFGGSTRLHIFQGPEDVEEKVEEKVPSLPVEEICTWGMGADADEETDLAENPYALQTPNEDSYIDDPKKTLKGWFEREGYEVEYKVEEKGFKTFSCQIQLPIDTPTGDFMTVEASVSGKKKEAVAACALEACRTLDRLGLLRQAQQESRERKKKNWEENDFYDSDDDTFLDRTGTIEKKREKRMMTKQKQTVETFESLEIKLKAIAEEISHINSKLSDAKNDAQSEKKVEDDSLDAYMSSLSETNDKASDKIERRKLKNRLAEAEKEKRHLEKLLEIARPSKLPPALRYPGMIGKRPKSKLTKVLSTVKEPILATKLKENEEEVEESDDEETVKSTKDITIADSSQDQIESSRTEQHVIQAVKKTIVKPISSIKLQLAKNQQSSSDNDKLLDKETTAMSTEKRKALSVPKDEIKPPMVTKIEKPLLVTGEEEDEPKEYGLILPKTKKISTVDCKRTLTSIDDLSDDDDHPSPKKVKKVSTKTADEHQDVYKTENDEYSTWVPPAGQTGDGMTHLNSKYGY